MAGFFIAITYVFILNIIFLNSVVFIFTRKITHIDNYLIYYYYYINAIIIIYFQRR